MNKNSNLKLKKSQIFLIGMLIVLSTLNVSANEINIIGWLAILIILLIAICFTILHISKKKSYPTLTSKILITLTLFNITYLIGIVNEGFIFRGIIVYLQLTLLMIFFILIVLIKWDYREIKVVSKFIELFLIINFVVLIIMRFPFPFKSFAKNSNAFSALMFFLSFFPVLNYLLTDNFLKRKYLLFIAGIGILLVVFGQSRSIWVTAIICLGVFWKWKFICKNRIRYYLFFGIIIIGSIGVVILLPLLRQHPNALIWNQFVREYTGGNLFSGRERIWEQLLVAIMERPIIGYGASITPNALITIDLSSHNLYLQTAIQVGLIGVCILFVLFLNIWTLMYRGRNNIYTRLSGSYFIGIIIYQSAEVSLTQNNLAIGIIMWLIIGIGISKSIESGRANPKYNGKDRCNICL